MAGKTYRKSVKAARKTEAMRAAPKAANTRKSASKSRSLETSKPALLSGGNPQIAKAEGDAPVQAYIAACRAERPAGGGYSAFTIGERSDTPFSLKASIRK